MGIILQLCLHMHWDLKVSLYLPELHPLGYVEEFHPNSIIPAEVGAILNIQIPMAVLNLCMECHLYMLLTNPPLCTLAIMYLT
jgi:hypothetical protein